MENVEVLDGEQTSQQKDMKNEDIVEATADGENASSRRRKGKGKNMNKRPEAFCQNKRKT